MHRAEYLNVLAGNAKLFRNAPGHDIYHQVGRGFRFLFAKEVEIPLILGKDGYVAAVDAVGVGDDRAVGGLAKDNFQPGSRHHPTGDHIPQHIACTYTGQLVGVTHQE